MKNFLNSLKLITDKIGNILPITLLLLTVAVSFASVQVAKSRNNYSVQVDSGYKVEAKIETAVPADVIADLERIAQIKLDDDDDVIETVKNAAANTCVPDSVLNGVCEPVLGQFIDKENPGHNGTDYNNGPLQGDATIVYAAEAGKILAVRNYEMIDSQYTNAANKLQRPGYKAEGACAWRVGKDKVIHCDWGAYPSKSYGLFPEYGNSILIQHTDGITVYGHLDSGSIMVSEEETVCKGQPIGRIGNTGWSSGFHLHFEIRRGKTNAAYSAINNNAKYTQDDDCAYEVGGVIIRPSPGVTRPPVPPVPPGITIIPGEDDIGQHIDQSASIETNEDGSLYMTSLYNRNSYSCQTERLYTIPFTSVNRDYSANEIKEVFGGVAGQWKLGDPEEFRVKYYLKECKDDNNPEYTCNNPDKGYTAGYAWTSCVKDFPLLQYLSALEDTPENKHVTTVEKNAYRNMAYDGPMIDEGDFTINFGNKNPGAIWLVNDDGDIIQQKIPLLGGAMANGAIYVKDINHLLHVPHDLVDELHNDSGYAIDDADDSWIAWLKLQIKDHFTDDTATISDSNNNEKDLNKERCTTLEAGPITKINESDALDFAYADQGGTCEQIVDSGNFEVTEMEICNSKFVGATTSIGQIHGVTDCTLDIPSWTHVRFNDGNWGKELSNPDIGLFPPPYDDIIMATPVPTIPGSGPTPTPVFITIEICEDGMFCGQKLNCRNTMEDLYRACNSESTDVVKIYGNPNVNWERETTWPNMGIEGLNKYLVNITQEEKDKMNPYGITVIHENVGIRINACFSLYDLQQPIGDPAAIIRSALEKEYLGRTANINSNDIFDPLDVEDDYMSDVMEDLESVNTNDPMNKLAEYVHFDPSMYNPSYSGGYNLSLDRDNNRGERVCYSYHIPFVGQIPRANERISYYWPEIFVEDSGAPAEASIKEIGDIGPYLWQKGLEYEGLEWLYVSIDPDEIPDKDALNQDYVCTDGECVDGLDMYLTEMGLGSVECLPEDGTLRNGKPPIGTDPDNIETPDAPGNIFGVHRNLFNLPYCSELEDGDDDDDTGGCNEWNCALHIPANDEFENSLNCTLNSLLVGYDAPFVEWLDSYGPFCDNETKWGHPYGHNFTQFYDTYLPPGSGGGRTCGTLPARPPMPDPRPANVSCSGGFEARKQLEGYVEYRKPLEDCPVPPPQMHWTPENTFGFHNDPVGLATYLRDVKNVTFVGFSLADTPLDKVEKVMIAAKAANVNPFLVLANWGTESWFGQYCQYVDTTAQSFLNKQTLIASDTSCNEKDPYKFNIDNFKT